MNKLIEVGDWLTHTVHGQIQVVEVNRKLDKYICKSATCSLFIYLYGKSFDTFTLKRKFKKGDVIVSSKNKSCVILRYGKNHYYCKNEQSTGEYVPYAKEKKYEVHSLDKPLAQPQKLSFREQYLFPFMKIRSMGLRVYSGEVSTIKNENGKSLFHITQCYTPGVGRCSANMEFIKRCEENQKYITGYV